MQTFVKLMFATLLAMAPLTLVAHSNHASFDPITQEQAEEAANNIVKNLVTTKQLPESWKTAKQQPITQRDTKHGTVWVVVFKNDNEKDESKQTLHVFVDEFGNPVSANHTGEL